MTTECNKRHIDDGLSHGRLALVIDTIPVSSMLRGAHGQISKNRWKHSTMGKFPVIPSTASLFVFLVFAIQCMAFSTTDQRQANSGKPKPQYANRRSVSGSLLLCGVLGTEELQLYQRSQGGKEGKRHRHGTSTRRRSSSISAAFLATSILVSPVTIDYSTTTTTFTEGPQNLHIQEIDVRLIPSSASALTENQILVNNVWTEVAKQYVDQSFNGLGEEGWRKKRLEAVNKVQGVGPDETEEVYSTIRNMLSVLHDPYTKFMTPDQFKTMTSYARGDAPKAGIGVQLMGDPATGKIVVLNTIPDGPATKSGVLPGDVIVGVDWMDVGEGATAEVVAAQCRGDAGTEVTLAVKHGGDGKPDDIITRISMKRSQIKADSVESSITASKNGDKVGLIKISSFNLGTERKVSDALNYFRGKDISAIALDLRGNPGGYMPAGVSVAKLFLPAQASVISEINKGGRATMYTNDGVGSEIKLPLYVFVDKRTASASEILTAALQDNGRAKIIGTKTFGKGRIQNLQELQDGSGLAVTKAKYMTPRGKDIHGVGISPDLQTDICGSDVKPDVCVKALI